MKRVRTQAKQHPRVDILGVRSGIGGHDPGSADGAEAFRAGGLAEQLRAGGVEANWARMLRPAPKEGEDPARTVGRLSALLAKAVRDSIEAGRMPLVIGGDHSCAVGTWSGAYATTRTRGPLGLVWIDAHLDSHTPATSHTGLPYGMPLAALLGHGDPDFTDCLLPGPKLKPEHVCIVGARDYEPEERALLDRLGVRVIGMEEIERRGLAAALGEAVGIAQRAQGGFGLSIDLDAIDPRDAPGVGTPVAGGFRASELIAAVAIVRSDPRLQALEIVEYNPRRDRNGMTLEHAIAITTAVLGVDKAVVGRERGLRAA